MRIELKSAATAELKMILNEMDGLIFTIIPFVSYVCGAIIKEIILWDKYSSSTQSQSRDLLIQDSITF